MIKSYPAFETSGIIRLKLLPFYAKIDFENVCDFILFFSHFYSFYGGKVNYKFTFSPIFTEFSTRLAQNDQPVTHRGVDDKLHDLFRA